MPARKATKTYETICKAKKGYGEKPKLQGLYFWNWNLLDRWNYRRYGNTKKYSWKSVGETAVCFPILSWCKFLWKASSVKRYCQEWIWMQFLPPPFPEPKLSCEFAFHSFTATKEASRSNLVLNEWVSISSQQSQAFDLQEIPKLETHKFHPRSKSTHPILQNKTTFTSSSLMAPWWNHPEPPTSRYEDDEGPIWPLVVPTFGGTTALLHLPWTQWTHIDSRWSNMAAPGYDRNCSEIWQSWIEHSLRRWRWECNLVTLILVLKVKLLPFFHFCFGSGFPNPLGPVSIEDQALISPRASNIKANPVTETKDKPSLSEAPESFSWTTQRMRPKRIFGHCEHPEVTVEFSNMRRKTNIPACNVQNNTWRISQFFLSVGADVNGKLSFTCS